VNCSLLPVFSCQRTYAGYKYTLPCD